MLAGEGSDERAVRPTDRAHERHDSALAQPKYTEQKLAGPTHSLALRVSLLRSWFQRVQKCAFGAWADASETALTGEVDPTV